MKFEVRATYTPDDPDCDRRREKHEFETENTDLFEIAIDALEQCGFAERNRGLIADFLEQDDVRSELADQDTDGFEFMLFPMNGQWDFEVNQIP